MRYLGNGVFILQAGIPRHGVTGKYPVLWDWIGLLRPKESGLLTIIVRNISQCFLLHICLHSPLLDSLAVGLDTFNRGEAISASSVDLASCILGEF